MQTVSPAFINRSNNVIRPIANRLSISFDKSFDASVTFARVGFSTVGGPDIVKGTGDAIQEWDKYAYTDYTDRLISAEVVDQQDVPDSISTKMLDITLDNHDGLFTQGSDSELADFILPYRPVRFSTGFDEELVQQFIGVTEKMPELDYGSKTAKFHCVDFLYSLFSKTLPATLYQDMRLDEVLADMLDYFGISASQYSLDTSFGSVTNAFIPDKTTFGDAAKWLVEAEMGRLYMDEEGRITFKNRLNYSSTSVKTFDEDNVVDDSTDQLRGQSDLINVVKVKSDIRTEQSLGELQSNSDPEPLNASGGTGEILVTFSDPITSYNDPNFFVDPATDSYYKANLVSDGSGDPVTSGISVTSDRIDANTVRFNFTNANAFSVFITELKIYGIAVTVTDTIDETIQDDDSVDEYGEQPYEINSPFVRNADTARTLGNIIIDWYGAAGSLKELKVKGNMALQISDPVTINLNNMSGTYAINKMVNETGIGFFNQTLQFRVRPVLHYARVGFSTIGGGDIVAP